MIHIDEILEQSYKIKITCHITEVKHYYFTRIKEKIILGIVKIITSSSTCNINDISITNTNIR